MTATTDSTVPLAKGSNLVGLKWAVEAAFDKATLDRMIAAVPEDLAAALRANQILPGGWYPLEWYKQMHRAAQQVTGRDRELARELARMFVAEQLGGIYKALLKLISPHWLFNYPSMLFSRYFAIGKLTIPESRAGYVHGLWTGCKGFDRNIWLATMGGSQAALERAGAKDVVVKIVGGAGEHDETGEAIGTWR